MSEDEEEEEKEEDTEIKFMMMLERDLYTDLQEQECEFIEELERMELEQLNLDVREFTLESHVDSESYVLCPLCCKSPLYMKGTIFLCNCGVVLDIGNDGLTLSDLKRNLAAVFVEHYDRGCDSQPKFELQSRFGGERNAMLVAKCDECEWLHVVL